jgi:hypothetical protein
MKLLREIVAVIIFIIGIFSVVDLVTNGINSEDVFIAVLCFICAYIVWPSKKKGQRDDGNSFLDILEFIIEAPVDILMWLLKMIGRLLGRGNDSSGGDGIDFDI